VNVDAPIKTRGLRLPILWAGHSTPTARVILRPRVGDEKKKEG